MFLEDQRSEHEERNRPLLYITVALHFNNVNMSRVRWNLQQTGAN